MRMQLTQIMIQYSHKLLYYQRNGKHQFLSSGHVTKLKAHTINTALNMDSKNKHANRREHTYCNSTSKNPSASLRTIYAAVSTWWRSLNGQNRDSAQRTNQTQTSRFQPATRPQIDNNQSAVNIHIITIIFWWISSCGEFWAPWWVSSDGCTGSYAWFMIMDIRWKRYLNRDDMQVAEGLRSRLDDI